MKISKRAEKIPPSGIRKFFDLVIGMKDVISLGVGEPDFTTPWGICESAIYSLEKGYTSYTSNKGLYQLRYQISRYLRHKYSLEYDPEEEILITVGTSEGLDLALRSIIDPNDKILIPQPSYVSYGPVSFLAGARPIIIETKQENNFKLTPKLLRSACSKDVKALILNYPSNPTGASYSKRELSEICKIAIKHNLIVISDEIYGDLTYNFIHTPIAQFKGMKSRTIYLNGFSKAFAMTGWRIGFACGPKEVISAMTKIHQYTMLCAPIMSQIAACEALKNGESSVLSMKKQYRIRRDFVVDRLNEMGLECILPDGAFYVFPSIKNTGYDSISFAERLLKTQKVAVVPGLAFGKVGREYIRISYASSLENLKEALVRIERFLKKSIL